MQVSKKQIEEKIKSLQRMRDKVKEMVHEVIIARATCNTITQRNIDHEQGPDEDLAMSVSKLGLDRRRIELLYDRLNELFPPHTQDEWFLFLSSVE